MTSCLLLRKPVNLLLKGGYSKRKEFAPREKKNTSLVELTPFQREAKAKIFVTSHESVSILLKCQLKIVNPLYTDTGYNDKFRYNDNLNVTKHSVKR